VNYKQKQKIHFCKRFRERTGDECSDDFYFKIRDYCLTGGNGQIKNAFNNCKMYKFRHKSIPYKIVFSDATLRPTTILPN
jgi:hypothetical protein